MKVIVPCHCANRVDFEYDEEVVLDNESIDSIISGNFMTVKCSKCGIILKPEFPVLFKYGEKPLSIFFIPELHRDSFLTGNSSHIHRQVDRFVIGFIELAEKLLILDSGLDDAAVECIKYYILSKIENESTIENEKMIIFDNVKDNHITYQIHGLKEKEVGMLNISMDYYQTIIETLEEKLETEPFNKFLIPPYISVLQIYRDYEKDKSHKI